MVGKKHSSLTLTFFRFDYKYEFDNEYDFLIPV